MNYFYFMCACVGVGGYFCLLPFLLCSYICGCVYIHSAFHYLDSLDRLVGLDDLDCFDSLSQVIARGLGVYSIIALFPFFCSANVKISW